MTTKLGRMVTYGGGSPPSKSPDLLITWSRDKLKKYIYTYTIPMATKLGRVITYTGRMPPTNSSNLLTTWSCEK